MEIKLALKMNVTLFLSLVAVILGSASVKAQQWTGPDGNGNISSANSGSVGVGTTSPNKSGVSKAITVNGATGAIYELAIGDARKSTIYHDGSTSTLSITNNANGAFTFGTNNTERVRIDSSGNVGIGTTNPTLANGYTALSLNNSTGTLIDFMTSNALKARLQSDGTTFYFNNLANGPIQIYTNSTERMRIGADGNVGIGTTSPTHRLVVGSGTTTNVNSNFGVVNVGQDQAGFAAVSGTQRTAYLFSASAAGIYGLGAFDYANSVYLSVTINWGGTNTLLNTSGGNVGIGQPNPIYKLDVNGNANVNGNVTASGSIAAKYQDVAEWVPSSEQLAAGTVVVLDQTKSNQVTSSTIAYDTRVAGVISAQPGIALGEESDEKVLVATTGRVRVKVDASRGSIAIGDLLVTSDIPGVAMKSDPIVIQGRKIHAPGTIIGKALEPLAKGKGEILVLLSLQ